MSNLTTRLGELTALREALSEQRHRLADLLASLGSGGQALGGVSEDAPPVRPGLLGVFDAELGFLRANLGETHELLETLDEIIGPYYAEPDGTTAAAKPQEGTLQRRKAPRR